MLRLTRWERDCRRQSHAKEAQPPCDTHADSSPGRRAGQQRRPGRAPVRRRGLLPSRVSFYSGLRCDGIMTSRGRRTLAEPDSSPTGIRKRLCQRQNQRKEINPASCFIISHRLLILSPLLLSFPLVLSSAPPRFHVCPLFSFPSSVSPLVFLFPAYRLA